MRLRLLQLRLLFATFRRLPRTLNVGLLPVQGTTYGTHTHPINTHRRTGKYERAHARGRGYAQGARTHALNDTATTPTKRTKQVPTLQRRTASSLLCLSRCYRSDGEDGCTAREDEAAPDERPDVRCRTPPSSQLSGTKLGREGLRLRDVH